MPAVYRHRVAIGVQDDGKPAHGRRHGLELHFHSGGAKTSQFRIYIIDLKSDKGGAAARVVVVIHCRDAKRDAGNIVFNPALVEIREEPKTENFLIKPPGPA